ncbi:MAG TPA: helicase-related protein [Terriglobia bacterium]|nr:helicase-related protein [Terriglobia bacterium]
MTHDFHPGQRWISESEPELGLGSILRLTPRTVIVEFRASGEQREYARNNAPLRRVRFRVGDTIQNRKGKALTIQSLAEEHNLLRYRSGKLEFREEDLSDTISFNKPEERLFAGQFDPPAVFDLRVAALGHQHRRRKSPVRGFLGGRIDLLPHQLYIASEVSSRLAPRVLLADEVGLGKTIEACLILHRLILTGRAQRVLILVPESLVHQWFVELLRRFNLWFHIYDEERCEAAGNHNPFLEAQLILCGLALFTDSDRRVQQAVDAGWDIIVVDEAHHLHWSPQGSSPEYTIVETLGRKVPGLLLLTATPEQLGMAGHFARLRLLDPDRFYDLDAFLKEDEHFRDVARQAEKIEEGSKLDALLDRHGTGRVRFRNTRATVSGFPERVVQLHPLDAIKSGDARIPWLIELLRYLDPEKVLLICRTKESVAAIETALRRRIRIEIAVFHEGLTLVQRDRNAAWFADEEGARILLCSEIGSEGRNFQFAHQLVLFDLPIDPEVLEQRIGRLDRIGQTEEIYIHIPFVINSFQEVLARWYHEGLNSFEVQLQGGRELLERFGPVINNLKSREDLEQLILDTHDARQEIARRLQEGRDRLMELNSFRPKVAQRIVAEIRREDADTTLEEFMLSVFDFYTLQVEKIADRTYKLGRAGLLSDAFPGLPSEGFTLTFDRARALTREDMQFVTWDHPLVTGAFDLLLGSEKGNCSRNPSASPGVEAAYVLECVAPLHLHIDRFLPPTPIVVRGDEEELESALEETREKAEAQVGALVDQARFEMSSQLQQEIVRLKELKKVNPSVRQEEIDLLVAQRRELEEHLANARIRLDAVRVGG